MFKVTESVDYLDPNPDVAFFDTRWEADEYLSERIHSRVEFEVQHSPYMVSEKNYDDLVQYESTLFNIEEVDEYAVDIDRATD
jgi:hypothetical protein